MSGNVEYGKCEICGKESVLERTVYYYENIICECHTPCNFEDVRHCKDCVPCLPPIQRSPNIKHADNLLDWTYFEIFPTKIVGSHRPTMMEEAQKDGDGE